MLDDLANIIENPHIFINTLSFKELEFAASTIPDGYQYGRGLSFISFALNYYGSGGELVSTHFKLTNIIIHAINSTLLFFILRIVLSITPLRNGTSSQRKTNILAGFITLLWACHPIQVSTVLYAVQRMTLLSGTSTLLGCLAYVVYRTSSLRGACQLLILYGVIGGCLIIGFHFKESAILLPIYLIALEMVVRRYLPAKPIETIALSSITVLPGLFGFAYLFLTLGNIQASYEFRDFSLMERLLTQPVVLFWYLKLILIPNLSDYSLFLDNFPISRSLFEPWWTSLAVAGLLGLIGLGLTRQLRYPLLPAIVWFFGGHLLESSFVPLEIAFEHRNYIPALGPLAFLSILVYANFPRFSIRPSVRYLAATSVLVIMTGLTALRAHYWSNHERFINHSIANRPTSVRAQSAAGLYYSIRNPEKAYQHYRTAAIFHPEDFSSRFNQYAILATIYNIYDDLSVAGIHQNLKVFQSKWTKASLQTELNSLEKVMLSILGNQAISAQTVEMLERAVYCRINDLHACPESATLLKWLNTAIENSKQKPLYRAYIQFSKCRILNYVGRGDEAIELLHSISQSYPENNFFKVKLGELYQQHGDEESAHLLLREADTIAKERY